VITFHTSWNSTTALSSVVDRRWAIALGSFVSLSEPCRKAEQSLCQQALGRGPCNLHAGTSLVQASIGTEATQPAQSCRIRETPLGLHVLIAATSCFWSYHGLFCESQPLPHLPASPISAYLPFILRPLSLKPLSREPASSIWLSYHWRRFR
jgi:hypothetical protein